MESNERFWVEAYKTVWCPYIFKYNSIIIVVDMIEVIVYTLIMPKTSVEIRRSMTMSQQSVLNGISLHRSLAMSKVSA